MNLRVSTSGDLIHWFSEPRIFQSFKETSVGLASSAPRITTSPGVLTTGPGAQWFPVGLLVLRDPKPRFQ